MTVDDTHRSAKMATSRTTEVGNCNEQWSGCQMSSSEKKIHSADAVHQVSQDIWTNVQIT